MNDSFRVKRCTHKSLQLGFFFLFFLKKSYLKCHVLSFKHSIHLFPNLNIHKIRIRRVLMVVVLVLKLEATIHYLQMFFKIGFRKNFPIFAIFTRKHLRWSLLLILLHVCYFVKTRLQHR